jgi:PAS domain S-box-containing protein
VDGITPLREKGFLMQLSIRTKLILILLIVVVIPMTITMYVTTTITLNRMEAELQARSMRALSDLRTLIGSFAKRAENTAELLAGSNEVKRASNRESIQKLLDEKQDLWFPGMVEIFDTKKRLLGRSHIVSERMEPFLTRPEDTQLSQALDLMKSLDYFVTPGGIGLRAIVPIVDFETFDTLGAVVVSYPFNVEFLQSMKEQVKTEVTVQWNRKGDVVSTFQDESGNPRSRLWGHAVLQFGALGDAPFQRQERIGSTRYSMVYDALRNQEGQIIGVVSAGVDATIMDQRKRETLMLILASFLMVVLFTVFVGFFMTRYVTRPILKLVDVLEGFGKGDYSVRAEVKSKDEIGYFADRFNNMLTLVQDANQQLMNIIDFLPDPTAVIDRERKVIAWNRAMEEMTGLKKEAVIGKDHSIGTIPFYGEPKPALADLILAPPSTGKGYEFLDKRGNVLYTEQFVPSLFGGKGAYLAAMASPLFDTQGNLVGAIESIRDITDRKRAEGELKRHKEQLEELVGERTGELKVANEQLQQEIKERGEAEEALRVSEKNLKTILYSVNVGILVVDVETHLIVDVNDRAVEMIGHPREQIVNSVCHRYICPAEEGRCPVTDLGQEVDNSEGILLGAKGEKIPIIKTVVSASLENRKRLIESFVDIRDRKQMEEERLKIHKLESLGTLAGGIAHDFNNLLGAILGNVALAKRYSNPREKIFHLLDNAEKISLRAGDLTKQFITFSRGGEPFRKIAFIGEAVRNAASFALSGSSVRCESRIPGDLWPVEVDEGQMRQVIHNMAINAREAMPEGGLLTLSARNVSLGAEEIPPLPGGRYVMISVEDAGVGIPESDLAKIFDPYFSTKERGNQKGMGLGLTTCYSIVRNHEGLITVESTVGKGTVFNIYLPSSDTKSSTRNAPRKEKTSGKRRILVMDDEETVRAIIAEMLDHLGYEVELAKDGIEAIDLYKRARESDRSFDAVIMDLTIPGGMGGREAVRKLLEIDGEARAIASSGYSFDPIMSEFAAHGFKGAMAKPYNLDEMGRIVSAVIEGRTG